MCMARVKYAVYRWSMNTAHMIDKYLITYFGLISRWLCFGGYKGILGILISEVEECVAWCWGNNELTIMLLSSIEVLSSHLCSHGYEHLKLLFTMNVRLSFKVHSIHHLQLLSPRRKEGKHVMVASSENMLI